MPTIFNVNSKHQENKISRRFEASENIPKKQPVSNTISSSPNAHAIASVEKLMQGPHQKIGLFAAYSTHPTGITFANQEPDEAILLFLRRHFITNIPWVFLSLLLVLIPPLFFFLVSFFPSLVLPQGLTIALTIFYYLLVTSYAFGKFISWFYNIGVVTQKRIVDLDSTNILAHNTATANFNEIVDVKFDQRGFFQSTFDYGNIHIQTEAIRANFEFDAAPKPTIVSDVISDLRVAQKGYHHGNT